MKREAARCLCCLDRAVPCLFTWAWSDGTVILVIAGRYVFDLFGRCIAILGCPLDHETGLLGMGC